MAGAAARCSLAGSPTGGIELEPQRFDVGPAELAAGGPDVPRRVVRRAPQDRAHQQRHTKTSEALAEGLVDEAVLEQAAAVTAALSSVELSGLERPSLAPVK